VYKIKKDESGAMMKNKVWLVAKGYVQQLSIDFEEVYALVARMESVCLILALVANEGWEVHHMDVKIVFLNSELAKRSMFSSHKVLSSPEKNTRCCVSGELCLRQASRA
jgi:hypothetical protein